jgi:predicted nucleotidyltransferase component of viral defense system
MIDNEKIRGFFVNADKQWQRNILREYLQCKILEIIYESEFSEKLSFIGGTALRLVYGTGRFSEDLDFDNFGLTVDEFGTLSDLIKSKLELEGMEIEIKVVHKSAFRCYIRFPKLLFNLNLSGYETEKILIQLDTESQTFQYLPVTFMLSKFDVFEKISVAPPAILLSQKLWAILNRKTPKGRDFYDATFLFAVAAPNYDYLNLKAGINNIGSLKQKLLERCQIIDLDLIKNDVIPFLIDKREIKRIEYFEEFIKSLKE